MPGALARGALGVLDDSLRKRGRLMLRLAADLVHQQGLRLLRAHARDRLQACTHLGALDIERGAPRLGRGFGLRHLRFALLEPLLALADLLKLAVERLLALLGPGLRLADLGEPRLDLAIQGLPALGSRLLGRQLHGLGAGLGLGLGRRHHAFCFLRGPLRAAGREAQHQGPHDRGTQARSCQHDEDQQPNVDLHGVTDYAVPASLRTVNMKVRCIADRMPQTTATPAPAVTAAPTASAAR